MANLIERQAAIDALADYIYNIDKVYSTGKLSAYDCKDAAESVIEQVPPAQPERKTGMWIYMLRDSENDEYRCSVCSNPSGYDYDYCPHCGANMVKGNSND